MAQRGIMLRPVGSIWDGAQPKGSRLADHDETITQIYPAAWDLLVGRAAERSALLDVVGQLTGGVGRVVWLEGEPGIGKSALVDALVDEAAARRVTVFRGAADELAQPLALSLVTDCLGVTVRSSDPALAEIAEVLRGTAAGTGVLDPVLAASERILELVDRRCAAGPVLLVAEDLHWSDVPSLTVLDRLGRAVDQLSLVLVCTCRPVPRREEVTRLMAVIAERAGLVLRLEPLDDLGTTELAGRLVGASPGPELAGELAQSGGNPLYVKELVAALVREDLVEVTGGIAQLRTRRTGLPGTLAATISRRLSLLNRQTRELLRLAALLGNEFEVRELALVTGRSAADLLPPLDEAVTEGVLVDAGDRLTFRHALIRSALEEAMPMSLRWALHGQFARLLAEADAPVNTVLRHLLAVPGAVDGWVAGWLAALPADALFAEPKVAAELLERTLAAPMFGGQQRDVLLTRLVTTLFWLGNNARTGELAAQAVRTVAEPELNARMHLYQIRIANRTAETGTALASATASAACAVAEERLPEPWRARIRAWVGSCLLRQGQEPKAYEQAELALADGTRLDDPLAVASARHVLSGLSFGATALAHIDAGLAALGGLGTDPDATELRSLLLHNRLFYLHNLGQRDEFDATVSRALILASRAGTIHAERIQMGAAVGYYDFGAWDEALVHLDSLQPPLWNWTLISRHGLAALIAARREDWDRMHEHAQKGSAIPVTTGDVRAYSGYLIAAQAIRAEADGDPARAVNLLAQWLDPQLGHDARGRYVWLPDLVRLALSVGDTATARAAVEAADADAARPDALPRQRAAAEFCRGQLDDDIPLLQAAADAYQRHAWTIGHAAALEEVAVRLAAAGDTVAARAALTEAVRGYADLDATWNLRRVDSRLRAYGIRRGPRSLHRRAASGWAALTPTELRIAELVAQGRSNPDIAAELYISRRTAEAHVSHILSKLGLRSRMEVMKIVAERTGMGGPVRRPYR
jgi:DNA-binding CsgD family transcriptional regulator